MQGMINLLSHSSCQKEIISLVCCLRKVVKVLQPQKMSFAIFSLSLMGFNEFVSDLMSWPRVTGVGGRDTECLAWCRTGHCTQGTQGDTHMWFLSSSVPEGFLSSSLNRWDKGLKPDDIFWALKCLPAPLSIPLCTAHRGYIRHRGGSSHILVQYLVTSPVCYRDSNHSHHITSKWFSNLAL